MTRLEGGLTTLAKAQKDTEELSAELAIKNKDIAEKKIIVTELIADITAKSEIASVQQKGAVEKKTFLEGQSVIIAEQEAQATKALEAAIPKIQAAEVAVQNIKQSDISETKGIN